MNFSHIIKISILLKANVFLQFLLILQSKIQRITKAEQRKHGKNVTKSDRNHRIIIKMVQTINRKEQNQSHKSMPNINHQSKLKNP